MSDDTLARDIDAACRLEGTFVLHSGQTSDHYFDKYLFESDPVLLRRVAQAMVPLLPTDTELLGATALRALDARVAVVVCAIDRSGIAGGPLADLDLRTHAVLTPSSR